MSDTVVAISEIRSYDSADALRLLDGVIDIYMPDIKYMDERVARELSRVKNYPQVVKEAVREMHRQVGDLTLDERGVALRGLLIRHLILPANLSQTDKVMRFVASEVSKASYVNLMDQYYPCFEAARYPDLDRRITKEEFRAAEEAAKKAGLARLDHLSYA
jgi:putative pyruvate formate lyase activating enzyme